MTIFQTTGNLRHNGTTYEAGSTFEGEREGFEALIADGTIRIIEAETSAEAAKIVAEEIKLAEKQKEAAPILPPNTWEAKKEEVTDKKEQAETTENVAVVAGDDKKPAEEKTEPEVTVGAGDLPPVAPEDTGDNL